MSSIQSHARDIETFLRDSIARSPQARLPTLRALARRFDMPLRHVQRVVAGLSREGLVRVAPRSGIVPILTGANRAPAPSPRLPSDESLYRTMRARIEDGAYKAGQPLPKTAYLAASERAGTRTVGRIYRRLVRDGLAYQKGRAIIVGRSETIQLTDRAAAGRCILIVQLNDPSWEELAQSWWAQPFAVAFLREMSLYGYEPVTVLLRETDASRNPTRVPAGKNAIAAKISELGARLSGMLVVNFGRSAYQSYGDELLDLLEWLCSFGAMVVSFDQYNEVSGLTTNSALVRRYNQGVAAPSMQRHFVRCYIDNREYAAVPLTALYRMGHRNAGYPVPYEVQPWIGHRLFYLREIAATFPQPMHILDSREQPPVFEYSPSTSVEEALRALSPSPLAIARNLAVMLDGLHTPGARCADLPAAYQDLLLLTARAGMFTGPAGPTAIIAPNDEHARRIYTWLSVLGVRVPADLSLVSFDDRQEALYPYTISSVNFGFDNLGYTAFHLILGDIPVKVDKRRSLAAISRLNHYATIGSA
jgi:DNA-binding transcriptional regulator YhcF (GntR family)